MIQFDVLFKNNQVADCEAACFGWLSTANDEWYRRSKIQTNGNKHLADKFGQGEIVAQELVWYPRRLGIPGNQLEDAWLIVKEITSEIKWLGDTVLLRPAFGTVHIKLGDNPCDKSILCIGIIRNFFTVPSFRESYFKARELGASIKEAYIFSGLVEVVKDWRGDWSACTRALWEYDSLNSATFGKRALSQIFRDDYSPWNQKPWTEQAGYHREMTLGEEFVGLEGFRNGKKLLDTFSVEDDEPIFRGQTHLHIRNSNDEVTMVLREIRQAMQA